MKGNRAMEQSVERSNDSLQNEEQRNKYLEKKLKLLSNDRAATLDLLEMEKKRLYHSLFFSHINYASQTWGQATSPNISRFLQLQKSAVRIITFSNFGVLSISDNVKLQNILLVFQILHNFAPTNICNLFSLSHLNSGYPTRGSLLHLLNKPLVRTTSFGINSIRYQCILNWNFLQSVISQHDLVSLSYYKLKSMVKASLLASYISD